MGPKIDAEQILRSLNVSPPLGMIGQFLLAKAEAPLLASWPKQQLGQWILHFHPNLPVREIRSPAGTQVGWILGLAVDTEGRTLPPVWHLPFDCGQVDAAIRFESELNRLGGRFAAVYLTARGQRFYLDASGSLAAVYCEDRQVLASSCHLIPQIDGLQRNVALIQALGISHRDGYFPFGLTPWSRISRLLPNHYLDLSGWTTGRHWPKSSWANSAGHPEEAVRDIAVLVEAFIAGVAKETPLQVPLTAGNDSRMLLACSRPSLANIRFYTDAIPDFTARMDCTCGRRIAKRFGLDYSVRAWREATKEEIDDWLYRTGSSVVDRISRNTGTDEQSDRKCVTLLGLGGEVSRGFYWRPNDDPAFPLASRELLRRFSFPAVDILVKEAANWLSELPTANLFEKLDLFYLEQRLGCWAGPSMYGPVGSRFLAYAFNSRQIYDKMLSLPGDYRREGRLSKDLIRLKWPELLEFPFNEPLGLLKLERKARNCLAVAKRAVGNSGARRIKSVLISTLRKDEPPELLAKAH